MHVLQKNDQNLALANMTRSTVRASVRRPKGGGEPARPLPLNPPLVIRK